MTPDSLVVKPERRTSSLSPPPVHHPPSQTDPATAIGPRMPSLADRKPLLKFSVSAILAKKGEEDSDRAALIKEESKIKEEDDAKPFVNGKQPQSQFCERPPKRETSINMVVESHVGILCQDHLVSAS